MVGSVVAVSQHTEFRGKRGIGEELKSGGSKDLTLKMAGISPTASMRRP
jgi:hypothetical protein